MKSFKPLYRLLPLGLIVVLFLLSVYAIAVAWLTNQAEGQAKQALIVSTRYENARYFMGLADQSMTDYRLAPGNDTLARFYSAETLLGPLLQQLRTASIGRDRQTIQQIVDGNTFYMQHVQQLIAAMNIADYSGAASIDTTNEALAASLAKLMDGLASEYQQQAIVGVTALAQLQHEVLITTPIVFVIGSLLVLVIWRQLHVFQMRLDQSRLFEIERLSQAALTDHLTELGNHRAFQEDIRRELARARNYTLPICLAMLDVDEFKLINDEHGHAFGDQVLHTLGNVFHKSLKEGQAYRIGGDEFAIILPHSSLSQARQFLEALRKECEKDLFGATLSMGVAALKPAISDAAELKEQADAALYEAKHRGRNRLLAFDDVQATATFLTTQKTVALRQLLKDQDIGVVFQPIWDISGRRLLAVEALARPDPTYGFSSPQEAFDIAQRMGHEVELDALCRHTILAHAHHLPPDVLLFINVCPESLEQGHLEDEALLDAVQAAGLTPQRIVLEVTERSFNRLDDVVREAERLRGMGFGLALDDTGAGNSGLEMLSSLAVDYVKIDRGILVKAMTDRAARGVLAGIIAIARETDSYVIAEGIEDREMFDMVRQLGKLPRQNSLGVMGVQGYLFGRPGSTIPTQVPDVIAEPLRRAA